MIKKRPPVLFKNPNSPVRGISIRPGIRGTQGVQSLISVIKQLELTDSEIMSIVNQVSNKNILQQQYKQKRLNTRNRDIF
jgi:hypothetical protein